MTCRHSLLLLRQNRIHLLKNQSTRQSIHCAWAVRLLSNKHVWVAKRQICTKKGFYFWFSFDCWPNVLSIGTKERERKKEAEKQNTRLCWTIICQRDTDVSNRETKWFSHCAGHNKTNESKGFSLFSTFDCNHEHIFWSIYWYWLEWLAVSLQREKSIPLCQTLYFWFFVLIFSPKGKLS